MYVASFGQKCLSKPVDIIRLVNFKNTFIQRKTKYGIQRPLLYLPFYRKLRFKRARDDYKSFFSIPLVN